MLKMWEIDIKLLNLGSAVVIKVWQQLNRLIAIPDGIPIKFQKSNQIPVKFVGGNDM